MRRAQALLSFLLLLPFPAGAMQAPAGGADYAVKRREAIELWNQHKELEALPVFEDLAAQNPKDAQVLLGLATALVSKAATIEDEAASAKVRIRARGLLLQAKELGLKNALLENLLELLPPDGIVHYSEKPADQAMRAAEAAFGRRDFDEAVRQYSKVLEYEPKNYSAVLYVGDSYFAEGNFDKAGEWYERATKLEPNRETAWRYWSDMLAKQGDLVKARELAIQAIIADPYNQIPWRGLQQWATYAKVQLTPVVIHPKASVSAKGNNVTINVDPSQFSGDNSNGAAWIAYGGVRALWPREKFSKQFPNEKDYRHSLAEESDALTTAAKVWSELAESNQKKDKTAAPDEDIGSLLKLYRASMIEPYVLLNAADKGIAQDYEGYREKNRDKLAKYLSEFIVPPAPTRSVRPPQ